MSRARPPSVALDVGPGCRFTANDRVNSTFSASRYAGVAATLVWSLGWLASACVALQRLGGSGVDAELVNVAVAVVLTALGLIVTVRSARHKPAAEPEAKTTHEPWAHRFGSWVAAVAWCGVGFFWNVAVIGSLIRASYAGKCLTLLIMIPFSLIGLLLLLVTFTSLGVAVDCLLHTGQSSASAIVVQPTTGPPRPRQRNPRAAHLGTSQEPRPCWDSSSPVHPELVRVFRHQHVFRRRCVGHFAVTRRLCCDESWSSQGCFRVGLAIQPFCTVAPPFC